MDYPHPWITLDKEGMPDLSHAYAVGIGAVGQGCDRLWLPAVCAGDADEQAQLNEILTTSAKTGLVFITDEDARPFGSAHPHAHLWDNGADPADELNRDLHDSRGGAGALWRERDQAGTPMAQLEETLVPLYLLHRYQTEAAIKEIGGLDYRYNLRGDGQPGPEIVSAAEQKKALAAVLKTLAPEIR